MDAREEAYWEHNNVQDADVDDDVPGGDPADAPWPSTGEGAHASGVMGDGTPHGSPFEAAPWPRTGDGAQNGETMSDDTRPILCVWPQGNN